MVMEGNRDESIKCIKIAQKCIAAGDREKAIKFLNKAQRLFPSQRAKGKISVTFFGKYFTGNFHESSVVVSWKSAPTIHTGRKFTVMSTMQVR